MATMIPDIAPGLIENSGEQLFTKQLPGQPAAYTVYYSSKFSAGEYAENPALIFEADFIIVHPRLGYLVVEVKEGQYQRVEGLGVSRNIRDVLSTLIEGCYLQVCMITNCQ